MSDPITWAAIEPAYRDLADALGKVDTILMRRADLSERQAFRAAFVALNHGVVAALNRLTTLHNEHIDDPVPVRPLEAVLADIVALGHEHIRLHRRAGQYWFETATTWEGMPLPPSAGGTREAWDAWEAEVEVGETLDADPCVATEARLAQVCALHAAKVRPVRHFVERVPGGAEPFAAGVCGTGCDETTSTTEPGAVNCPACIEWIEQNTSASLVHFEFTDPAVCADVRPDPAGRNTDIPGDVTCPACRGWIAQHPSLFAVPGPEVPDSEHGAHIAVDPVAREDAARETGASEDSV